MTSTTPKSSDTPRVSVGIPVFNGAKLLRDTLENLERQSFSDIAVFISDNGSTDATPDICAEFARKDSRFHHIRQPENIGALPNFFAVRDHGISPLYMWRAFDDISDDNYIEELVKVHDRDPGTILATCDVIREGSPGTPERVYPYTVKPDGNRLWRTYLQILHNSTSWYYGLWEYETLVGIANRVREGFPDEWAFDQLVLLGVALKDGVRGTRTTTFRQRKIIETRDYIPRPKPTYPEMHARNARFSGVAYGLIAESNLSVAQKRVLTALVPYYTRKRCDAGPRLLRARIKMLLGKD